MEPTIASPATRPAHSTVATWMAAFSFASSRYFFVTARCTRPPSRTRALPSGKTSSSLQVKSVSGALEEANRLFRETCDMEGLLSQIVKLAVDHSGGDRGFVAFSANAGRLDVVAQHGLGRDRARRYPWFTTGIALFALQLMAEVLLSGRMAMIPLQEVLLTLADLGAIVALTLAYLWLVEYIKKHYLQMNRNIGVNAFF